MKVEYAIMYAKTRVNNSHHREVSIMKYIAKLSAFALIMIITLTFSGCSKKETTFDFSKVAEARLYTAKDTECLEFLKKDEAQKLIKPISEITWKKGDESTDDSTDYIYRIQCYTIKGEKSKSIKITDDGKIIYNSYYWEGEENPLDTTYFKEYFAQ